MKQHLSTLALALTSGAIAIGEEALPTYELEEVIVRSDLWETGLLETNASVSVLSAYTLERSGSQHFEDVINAIPNLTWTGGSSRPRYLQIRGIGENSQFEGETPDSTVRFLIDGFDLTGIGTVGNLFDVQQVEVLRGPQAGAYGANAAGGVVKVVSTEPTPYWTGTTEAAVGNDDLISLGLALGGPLLSDDPDHLTFRFSINQLNQNGFRENQFLGRNDTNERDELSSRLKVRWKASEDLEIDLGALYGDVDNGYDEFTLNNSRVNTFSDEPGRDEQETAGISLNASYEGFDAFSVDYLASAIDTASHYSFDGDWTDASIAAGLYGSSFLEIDREREVITQNLRFDSSDAAAGSIERWTAGIYIENLEEQTITSGFGDFRTNYESETVSFYGQATHAFSEETNITLGLRAEHYSLDTEMDFRDDVDFDDWLVGGKLTIEHDLDSDNRVFASITRGYKAGGANIYPFLDTTFLPDAYDTEDLWNYEIGLSSFWMNGKLSTRITAFYLDRDDAQLRDSAGTGIDFTYFTSNGEGAEHYGLEFESNWYFTKDWSVSITGGLLSTSREAYTDLGDTSNTIPERDLANSPAYAYSASLDYSPQLGLFARAEISGSDAYFESNSHNEERNSFAVVNASIGYRFEDWSITLWTKNLLDEAYEERVFFFDNGLGESRYEAPAAPRTYGVTARYDF